MAGLDDDMPFDAEDVCFCEHAHHRHDMGNGCIECRCRGFRYSIVNLAGAYPDMTGGLCSVCYVKVGRGYEPSELPHLECARVAREAAR